MDFRNRILAIDDDIATLEQLELFLSTDYVVSLASTGAQALSYLKSEHWVDIIILDVMMAEMDGYEVLQKIRELQRYKNTPVIFLTSLCDTESEVKGLELGVDYITKPYTPIILKSRIERALRTAGCLDAKKIADIPRPLSESEYFTACLIARGCSNEEIANTLHYAHGTVKNMVVRVMNKLSIYNRNEIERYKKQ